MNFVKLFRKLKGYNFKAFEDIPEFIDWHDLPNLPTPLKTELAEWANSLDYFDANTYNVQFGHDFVKHLSTDWANHLNSLGIAKSERVIDIGTGTGRCRLSAIKGGYTAVYGLDTSESCLKVQANTQTLMGIELDASQLISSVPEEMAGTFSAVCISASLHHIADTDSFLSFVSRLLKNNGVLIAYAEPMNMRRYNAFCGISTRIPLRDIVRRMRAGDRERTHETMLLAEFHVGAGFSRADLEKRLNASNLFIKSWDVYQYISLVAINHVKQYVPAEKLSQFMEHYERLLAFDEFLKAVNPDFAHNNFFTFLMVARKK